MKKMLLIMIICIICISATGCDKNDKEYQNAKESVEKASKDVGEYSLKEGKKLTYSFAESLSGWLDGYLKEHKGE